MSKLITNVIVILLMSVVLPPVPGADTSCTCLSYIPNDASISRKVKYELKKSKAVFSGEVLRIDKRQGGTFEGYLEVTFKVKESWKRVKGETVLLITAPSKASCGYTFQIGESYLVYVENWLGDNMLVGICSRTMKLSDAAEDLKVLGKGKITAEGK